MRNWYLLWLSFHFCQLHSRTLPMRNWYQTEHHQPAVAHLCDCRSDITYEELIRLTTIPIKIFHEKNLNVWDRRTLPMRNWYLLIGSTTSLWCRTLPMRNWYIIPFLLMHICTSMSDITYEELIRNRIKNKFCYRQVGHYLWGIDTKSWTVLDTSRFKFIVGHYLWGIDTFSAAAISLARDFKKVSSDITYEELIRQWVCQILLMWSSWSRTLPMRNWYTPVCIAKFAVQYMHRLSDITYEELIQTWKSNT